MKIDLDFVRNQFPAFSEESLLGKAFFENAGGSYMCKQVIDRFNDFYVRHKVQPYGFYKSSEEAGLEMDKARERMAGYLNVFPNEVSFGPSTSQNTYVLSQGFLDNMNEGDSIIVSEQEHEANAGSWHKMSKKNINVIEWKIDAETGRLNIDELKKIINEDVKIVAVTHCSNVVGEINPIKEISEIVHKNNSILITDGVSLCPHGFPDVNEIGSDVYLFSSYKTYGPHQGIMVIREKAKSLLSNQSHFFNKNYSEKFMVPAGPDHAQVACSNGILDYLDLVHNHHFPNSSSLKNKSKNLTALFRDAEIENLKPLLEYLSSRNDIKLIGPSDNKLRAPTVAFTSQTKSSAEVVKNLSNKNIMAGAGDFYAYRPLKSLGINPEEGVVRLSFVHYTSMDEVNLAIKALDQVL